MYLIVGLGNPGSRYANTYHNLGFMAVDVLREKLGFKNFKNKGYMAETTEGTVPQSAVSKINPAGRNSLQSAVRGGLIEQNDGRVIIAKPQTYMNLSGDSVKGLMSAHRIPIENLIVIYDDIDLPRGSIRLRPDGSAGTHNGMKNIVERLGTSVFKRVRIGSGPAPEWYGLADFVLSDISGAAMDLIGPAIQRAAEAAGEIVAGEMFAKVMGKYNTN